MTKRIITQEIVKNIANATREVLTDYTGDEVTSLIEVEELPDAIDSIPYGWYGVRKDREVTNSVLTRIGSSELHKSLPIQSKMRRCLLLDDGTVNYYLHPSDSRYKENGELAVLDGTDGQVMVEIPDFFVKYETYTDSETGHVINEWKISEYNLPGFTKVNKCYYSAFEAALDRTNLKLSSVVNKTAQYRGGNNTSSWDNTYRSLLGMPVTNKSLTEFRTYASNRGSRWTCHDNNLYTVICTLYLIEYANTNIQLPFNATLTQDGYRQGGLGDGVTAMVNSSSYNQSNPIIPCGATLTLGNNTGIITYGVINSTNTTIYSAPVPSYRGIENLFGHVDKITDGILVYTNNSSYVNVYCCYDIAKYKSSLTSNYVKIGTAPMTAGYTKNVIFPILISTEIGANSSTGWCDYYYNPIRSSDSPTRVIMFGGNYVASNCGIAFLNITYGTNAKRAQSGTRLCYHPLTQTSQS